MLSSGVWCSRVPCAYPWGSPDRGACHMSSWGIRMELFRIVTRGITHSTRGRIQSGWHSTFSEYLTFGIPSADIPPSPDISHSAPNARWERRTFQLPRSDMSGSSDNAYPESFSLNIQCRGVLLKLPDISDRHFKIFCFRYLMSKSPNSPCNPPIIGFLSL